MKFYSNINISLIKVILILFVILNVEIVSINTLTSINFSLKGHKSGSLLKTLKKRLNGEQIKELLADTLLHRIAHELCYLSPAGGNPREDQSGPGIKYATVSNDDESKPQIQVLKYVTDEIELTKNTRMLYGRLFITKNQQDNLDSVLNQAQRDAYKKIAKHIAVIAFRGSEMERKNWITNANGFQIDADQPENATATHKIHTGFSTALKLLLEKSSSRNPAQTVLSHLTNFLNGQFKDVNNHDHTIKHIIITGHSLGGALAVSLAHKILVTKINQTAKVHLVTFGAPRVGNKVFAEYINNNERIFGNLRFVYGYDLVTHLPPQSIPVVGNLIGPEYQHAGTWIQFEIEPEIITNKNITKYAKRNKIGNFNKDNLPSGISNDEIKTLVMKIGLENAIQLAMNLLSVLKQAGVVVSNFMDTSIEVIANTLDSVNTTIFEITTHGANRLKFVIGKGLSSMKYYSYTSIQHLANLAIGATNKGTEVLNSLISQGINITKEAITTVIDTGSRAARAGHSVGSTAYECVTRVLNMPFDIYNWMTVNPENESTEASELCAGPGDYSSLFIFDNVKMSSKNEYQMVEEMNDPIQFLYEPLLLRRRKLRRLEMGDIINNVFSPENGVRAIKLLTYLAIAGVNHTQYRFVPQINFLDAIKSFVFKNKDNQKFTNKYSIETGDNTRRFKKFRK
jgi:hypothetical protein